jgi:energy-coupling factor transporter ATP-binding protein EcfA2
MRLNFSGPFLESLDRKRRSFSRHSGPEKSKRIAGAERTLLTLHCHFRYERTKAQNEFDDDGDDPDLLAEEEVGALLAELRERLRVENLLHDSRVLRWMEAVDRRCAEPTSAHAIQDIEEALGMLLKTLRPIDIKELMDYIESTVAAAGRIKDQDVVLLLGSTGAGKSTTVLFLAGEKMSHTYMDGLVHIGPVGNVRPELAAFTATPFDESETRVINAVRVESATTEQPIMLCDSPGFGDTGGPEIDISNGIGVAAAMRGCRSVKILVVASKLGMGDRLSANLNTWLKPLVSFISVRARPGRSSALRVSHSKSFFDGAFAWARRARNSPKRRSPARAVHRRPPADLLVPVHEVGGGRPGADPQPGARH